MTKDASASTLEQQPKYYACMDLRIGVFVILGLLMLKNASSIAPTGAAVAREAALALAMIVLCAVTMRVAHKRKVTGYKVCVCIHIVMYVLGLLGSVLILEAGYKGIATLADPKEASEMRHSSSFRAMCMSALLWPSW